MKDKYRQYIFIIIILTIVFILENLNYFRYPIYISRYATSNIILEYAKENGRLPMSNLDFDDFYQPIIITSNLLLFFLKLFNTTFASSFLLSYSFPIIIYLLTIRISEKFLIIDTRKKSYIALFNCIIASISTYILDMSNDLFIFFIIFLLIYIHIKDNFSFSKRFYLIACFSSIFITFYYYTGLLIFAIFMLTFYLYYLIIAPKPNKGVSYFLFLSCLNFFLIFLFYGIVGGVGFISTFQTFITRFFLLPSEWFFLYSSLIVIIFHVLLQKKFKFFIQKIINFSKKSIKFWIPIIILLGIAIIIFIILNIGSFLSTESLVLEEFNFPPAYYNPLTRFLNFLNLFIIIVPYLLFSISIIRKFQFKLKLNKIDLLYLISILLIVSFILIYYLYGGLNMILNRSIRMITVFALVFTGFFYLNIKSFFVYILNPNKVKVKIVILNEKKINSFKTIFSKPNFQFNGKIINKLIIYVIFQSILQLFLVLLLNKTEIEFNIFKIIIININYFFLPGFIFLETLNLKTRNVIENYLFSAFISFGFLILGLAIFNSLSIIFINFLLILPYIFFSLIFISALLLRWFQNIRLNLRSKRVIKYNNC